MNFGLYLIRRNVVVVRCWFRHVSGATTSTMAAAISVPPLPNLATMRSSNARDGVDVKFNVSFIGADITSTNANLSSLLESGGGAKIDCFQFLTELGECGQKPDKYTFLMLSHVYSLQGNPAGILKILAFLGEMNIYPSRSMIANLAYAEGLASATSDTHLPPKHFQHTIFTFAIGPSPEHPSDSMQKLEAVNRVAQLHNKFFPHLATAHHVTKLYLRAADGFAHGGDLSGVLACFRHLYFAFPDNRKQFTPFYHTQLTEIFASFRAVRHQTALILLRPYVRTMKHQPSDKQWSQDSLLKKVLPNEICTELNSSEGGAASRKVMGYCLQLLADGHTERFEKVLGVMREHNVHGRIRDEFFWLLLKTYYGRYASLEANADDAFVKYLKLSQSIFVEYGPSKANVSWKSSRGACDLHLHTLLRFLKIAKAQNLPALTNKVLKAVELIENKEFVETLRLLQAKYRQQGPSFEFHRKKKGSGEGDARKKDEHITKNKGEDRR